MAYEEPIILRTNEPVYSALYPFDAFIHGDPTQFPCIPKCEGDGSRTLYGVFPLYGKFIQFTKGQLISTEVEEPIVTFDPWYCRIPSRAKLNEYFDSNFYLIANVILPAVSETLFFGIRYQGVDYILTSTVAECTEYPCSGVLELKWNIDSSTPAVNEFLEAIGVSPKAGVYEYAWITGHGDGIVTDMLPAQLAVIGEQSNLPGVLSVLAVALGSMMLI